MAKTLAQRGLVDATRVADRLGVTPRYVRRLVAERRIRYVKVGHLVRFYPEDVEALIEAVTVDAIPERHLTTPPTSEARRRSAGSQPLRHR